MIVPWSKVENQRIFFQTYMRSLLWTKGGKHWQPPSCSRTIENAVNVCINVPSWWGFARKGWQGNINAIILRWLVGSVGESGGTYIRSDHGVGGLIGFRFHCEIGGQAGVFRLDSGDGVDDFLFKFDRGAGSLACVIRFGRWVFWGYGCFCFPNWMQRAGYWTICAWQNACIWLVHLCLHNSERNPQWPSSS